MTDARTQPGAPSATDHVAARATVTGSDSKPPADVTETGNGATGNGAAGNGANGVRKTSGAKVATSATAPTAADTPAVPGGATTPEATPAVPVKDRTPSTTKFVRPPGMNPPPTTVTASAPVGPGGDGTSTGGRSVVADAVRAARATVAGAASRGPRRARLHLRRIDPWSMMKFSFAVSLVLFIVMVVATTVLYLALDAMGVFDSVNKALATLVGTADDGQKSGSVDFQFTAKGVIGTAALLGVVNMVLFTALSTLGAFVYNVCADLVGGIELTLSEKE